MSDESQGHDASASSDPNLPALREIGDIVPRPPKELVASEAGSVEAAAQALAQRIVTAPDDLKTLSQLTRLGEDAQQQVSSFLESRKVTVGDMMKQVSDGTHNPLPNQIKQMRSIMDRFDPRPFRDQIELAGKYGGKGLKNLFMRKARGIPMIGDLLRSIADNFKPISDEIDNLLMAMEAGIVRLDENTAAVLTQTDELKKLIVQVELRAYEAELVFAKLKEMHAQAAPEEQQKIMNAMSRVGKRALFLRANEQIFLQVLTGLRTSVTTNFELRDTVSMLRDQAAPLLTNLYALIIVQEEARQIAEAASATQEMVTDLLKGGAEMTRDNVETIGRVGIKMMTEMDKLIESKNIFLEAVAKADLLAEQTVAAATQSIPVLQEASNELKQVVREHETADLLMEPPAEEAASE